MEHRKDHSRRAFAKLALRAAILTTAGWQVMTARKAMAQVKGFRNPADVARFHKPPAAGGGGCAVGGVYYGIAPAGYTSGYAIGTADNCGDDIVCTNCGNITSIGYLLQTVTSGSLKLGLYYNNGGTWTLVPAGTLTIASPVGSDTWNDATLGTPYSVTAGQTVRVVAVQSGTMDFKHGAGADGMYFNNAYATSMPATPTFETADYRWAVRCTVSAS